MVHLLAISIPTRVIGILIALILIAVSSSIVSKMVLIEPISYITMTPEPRFILIIKSIKSLNA